MTTTTTRSELPALDLALKTLWGASRWPGAEPGGTIYAHPTWLQALRRFDQLAGVHASGILHGPHGTGKSLKVAVVCQGENVNKANAAGADFVGGVDLIEKIEKGFLGFDCLIATPDMMKDLSKLGKVLGPRGLMPSPKAGTVTADVERALREVKAGRVEFKNDKQGGIHLGVGKRSFSEQNLYENAQHLIEAVDHAKPASVKGVFIKSVYLSTTMGVGVKVAI